LSVGLCPVGAHLLSASLRSGLESELVGVGLDDEEGVAGVKIGLDGLTVLAFLVHEVEAPKEATAGNNGLVTGDALTETGTLTVAERSHAHDGGELGERLLEGGPAGFEPALRAVVLRVRILGGVALEGAVKLLVV
jgi:hypothetical protein